jgi:glutathione S-transferase
VDGGEDDGLVLWESNAILRYLVDRHAPHLWPEGLAARARSDRWMDWQFQYADAQRPLFVNKVRRSPEAREADEIAASEAAAAAMLGILDAELARHPWLSGPAFGVADVPMGVYAHTYFTLASDRPALPHVESWYARLQERPGYAANVMIPMT